MATSEFNFRLSFTGLCTLVPNLSGDEPVSSMTALLVNGRQAEALGEKSLCLDGRRHLARHYGFVAFSPRDLVGGGSYPGDTVACWPLNRVRLEIHPVFAKGGSSSLSDAPGLSFFEHGAGGGAAGPAPRNAAQNVGGWNRNLPNVADLNRLTGNAPSIDPNSLCTAPPRNVLAQVKIDQGTIWQRALSEVKYRFGEGLGPHGLDPMPLAHEVAVDLENVERVDVYEYPLGDPDDGNGGLGRKKVYVFQAIHPGEWVELMVANLCDENPLAWPGKMVFPEVDRDFKWHYELHKDRDELPDRLCGRELPHPRPIGHTCCRWLLNRVRWYLRLEGLPPRERLHRAGARARIAAGGDDCYPAKGTVG